MAGPNKRTVLLAWAGGAWDVAWHHTIGRDTFWTA